MSDLRRSRLLLTGRKHAPVFLVTSRFPERVLAEIRRPEIAHLEQVPDLNIFGGNPTENRAVVAGGAPQVNMIVRRIPSASRQVGPSLQAVFAARRARRLQVDLLAAR